MMPWVSTASAAALVLTLLAAPEAAAVQAPTATTVLGGLSVKGRAPLTGYERSRYGPAWADIDRNGCDTRNDVLRRDLTGVSTAGRCLVVTGRLADPYTGRVVAFDRRRAAAVQIDHVVALSASWRSGAQGWSAAKRLTFANDPLNLLAVDGAANQAKSGSDAASWLPPARSYRCRFVARQVAVKAKYGLWVTAAEKAAVARVLLTCPAEPVPTGGARLPGAPAAAGSPGDAVNCVDFPSWRAAQDWFGQYYPAFGDVARLDVDSDGVACEGLPGAP